MDTIDNIFFLYSFTQDKKNCMCLAGHRRKIIVTWQMGREFYVINNQPCGSAGFTH